jgi:hypothetical protein
MKKEIILLSINMKKTNLNKISEKEKSHDNAIYSCIGLNNGIVASGGVDCLINFWKKKLSLHFFIISIFNK